MPSLQAAEVGPSLLDCGVPFIYAHPFQRRALVGAMSCVRDVDRRGSRRRCGSVVGGVGSARLGRGRFDVVGEGGLSRLGGRCDVA